MTTTTKLGLPLLQNAAANQTLANTTFAQLNQLVQAGVADRLSSPPGSPADEALYIITATATGAWTGRENQLAYWLAETSAWQYIVPREGMLVHVNDEDVFYKYSGSAWGTFATDGASNQSIIIACSDETTALTTGTAKVTFRMPYGFTLSAVRASLTTAQTSGSILTVDINEGGTSILSTKLTIDNTEKSSVTAATPAVISDASLADDGEITIDIDQIGDGTAKGLKVTLIGVPA